jgi:hypothetical protein
MPALTAALVDPMLDTVKSWHLRQIEHLPRLGLHDRRIEQVPPAALAPLDRMKDRPVGILAALKMMPVMPGLAARLASRAAPQTTVLVRRRLRVPVRRRRPGGVARVLIKPRPQRRDHRLKLGDPRRLVSEQRIALDQQTLELGISRAACMQAARGQHSLRAPAILLSTSERSEDSR